MIQKIKKPVSILLALMMVVSLFAIVPITASAEELMETISFRNEQEVRKISGTHFTITPHADGGINAYDCWDFDGDYPDDYAELTAVYGETITKLVFHIDTGYDNYPIVKAGGNRIAGSQSGDLWTFDNVNASSVRISANPNYAAEGKQWWCFDVFELDVYYDASNAPAPSDIVQELIDAIGTVTLTDACKEKIDAARSAYDKLSQADQALVNNYKTLTDAEAAYQGLVDQAAADRAIAAINAIGTFESTPQYKVLFDRANNTYNGLTDAQKALVTNYDVLVAARTAAEELPYVSAGNFGGLYWAIDKDGVMTFAGSGETDMNAFRNNSSIRKVIINSSVTKLKSYTFGNCYNLTEVEFRNSNPKIDNFVFAGCGKLSKVTLAEGLTSIGYNMFNGCGALHELNLPRSVNYIETEAFDGSGIQTLRIPYGLRHAVSALKGMGQLTTLMIDSDTSIAYTSGDFPDLGSVTNVYVPVGSTFKTQDSKKTVLAVKEQYLNDYSESDFAAAKELFNMSMYDYGNDPEYALWEVGESGYEKDKYEVKEVTVPGKNMTLTDGAQVSELFGAATIRTYTTAVSSVEALIDAIGTVELTDECKEKVDAARAAYEELSDVQKAFISNETLAKLEAAEDAFVKVSVTWKNDDGTVLKTEDVAKGATPTYNGTTPEKADDEKYTYTFSGWTDGTNTYGKDDTLPAVTGDITYTATFTASATVLEMSESYNTKNYMHYDEWLEDNFADPIDSTNVTITPEDQMLAFGTGWSPGSWDKIYFSVKNGNVIRKILITSKYQNAGRCIAGERQITGVKNKENNVITYDKVNASSAYVTGISDAQQITVYFGTAYIPVTWKNGDAVIGTDYYDKRETPTYNGTTPEKADDEKYTYTFSGWTDGTNTYGKDDTLPAVTDDITYTATYTAEDKAVKNVIALINALPATVTVDDKVTIEAARAAYDALTDDQKTLITTETLDKLTAAETALAKATADKAAADAVITQINSLPADVTVNDKATIEAARAAYDALTDDQKALVTNETLDKLTAGEEALAKAIDDKAAADAVTAQLNALPTDVTVDDKAQIEAARAAYDALTDDQKALITTETIDKLTVAETALAEAESRLNGPQDDGYFYLDDVKQIRYQLIQWHGDYYFINDGDKYAKNIKLYLSNTYVAGSGLSAGLYVFGADGKMQLKNGPQDDGYFYENGIRSNKLYRFVEFEGDWYFIYDGYKYAKNAHLYLSGSFLSGTDFEAGYYDFDADGKYYIPEELPEGANADGYFYINGVKQLRYQLIKYGNDYYFINDGDQYAKNIKLYLTNTYLAGTGLSAGLYVFGADGKMQLKNGPQDDGYFYENGVRSNKLYRFVEFEGDWYFIYDGYKYAKNARLYLGSTFLKGTDFAPGYYVFGADGKMVIAA